MPRYLLIRSGATEWDDEDRIRGDFDIPLSAAGRAEVTARLREIKPYNFRACWAGTDQPADETASILQDKLGCRVRHHPGLREVHRGFWQGLLRSDVRRKHRRVYAEWQEDPEGICPPSGEPLGDAVTRVGGALREIGRRHRPDELVALVCSTMVAALVQCAVEDVPVGQVLHALEAAPPLALLGASRPAGAPAGDGA